MEMKIKMKNILIACLLSILVFSVGCGSNTNADINSVRIAHFPNITHSQALLQKSDDQSFILRDKAGKEIPTEWKSFNAGPAEVEALLAGEVDIGYIGPGPALNAFAKSKGDVVIIAGVTNAGAILVARPDLIEMDLKAVLANHKIAVPQFGNTQDLCLRNLLEQNNLQDTAKGGTVEIVQAENPDIKTLLEQKSIDAAFVPEPWGARLVNEVGARIVLDEKGVWRNGEYTTAVVVVRKEFLQKHADLVEAFLKNHVEATLKMQQDLDKNKAIVNQQIAALTKKSLPEKVLDDAFARMAVTYNPQKDSVVDMAEMAFKAGFSREKIDTSTIFQLEILNKVLKEKGLNEI